MTARWRELFGLLPVSLLVTAGFAAVLITRSSQINKATATYGAIFLGACVVAHLFIRARLRYADPYVFPLLAVLAGFGLIEIYRISPHRAAVQAIYFAVGLALFVATILFVRDYRVLERYRYTIAVIGILLLLAPRLPGIGRATNGAYLSIGIGPVVFQPGEVAKLAIVIFLASYLNDTRDVLVQGRSPLGIRDVASAVALLVAVALALAALIGHDLPRVPMLIGAAIALLGVALRQGGIPRVSLKHLGPLLVIWGLAMLMLLIIRDLGTALMFFGAFLALLYIATNRLALVLPGLGLFVAGAAFLASHLPHVHDRVQAWLHPFSEKLYNRPGGSYQLAQSLFSQADGGLFGKGFGEALLTQAGPHGQPIPVVPAAHTDLIYAVIVNEVGLFGGVALLLVYLLLIVRGFKTAALAHDGFSKLLAAGLSAVFALQVFVIVGGVTKVIPLTGVTLPFVSYGGSSIVANFVLVALLLLVSDRARRDPLAEPGGLVR